MSKFKGPWLRMGDSDTMTEQEVVDILRQRVASAEWWVFPAFSREPVPTIRAILEKFYLHLQGDTQENSFWDGFVCDSFMLDGHLPAAIFVMKKTYMLPDELVALLGNDLEESEADVGIADIILADGTPKSVIEWLNSRIMTVRQK